MICPYCQKEFPKNNKLDYSVCICDVCHCIYRYSKEDDKILAATIMLFINDIQYWIELNYMTNKTTIMAPAFPNIEREMRKQNATHTCAWTTIKQFDQIIKITPSNAEEKLKTILNFM